MEGRLWTHNCLPDSQSDNTVWRQDSEVTWEAVKVFPIPLFGKHICYESNGIKLHNMQKSAGSAVGDISIHQGDQAAIQEVTGQTVLLSIMCLMGSAY